MDTPRDNDTSTPAEDARHPWHDDHPLSPDEVRRILHDDGIELPLADIEAFGSGWDFNVFRVDSDWLFRFPRRADCMPMFHQEFEALAGLNQALKHSAVRFPNYVYRIERSVSFPLAYGGYRMLPGATLLGFDRNRVDVESCAERLGVFLKRVHECTPLAAPRACPDPFPAHLVDIREEFDQVGTALPAHIARACARLLARPYPVWEGTATFHHADLGPEHMVIDPVSGLLTGIIDWGDAGWGDPMLDFVGWWAWTGDEATAAALEHYGTAPDHDAWTRLRFRGACVAISEAYYGWASGRFEILDASVEALERMYAAGHLHDTYPTSSRRTQ